MKRLVTLLVCAAMMATLLAGCGSKDTAQDSSNTGSGSDSASGAPVEVLLGWDTSMDDPIGKGAQKWAEYLTEMSGGTMEMKLYPSNQLGSKNDMIDQMLAGGNVITLGDGGFFGERGAPDMGILMAPYLFDSFDDAWTLAESDWYKEQAELLSSNGGLKILTSNWIYGLRHYLTKTPVYTVDDMKGLKIRVADSTVWINGTAVLGATPAPMAFSDAYTALQQGVVDGIENPAPQLYDSSFYECAKYLTLTGHVKNTTCFFTSSAWFDTLTEEQQNWLIESGKKAGVDNQEAYYQLEAEAIEKMTAAGVTVIELDEATYNGFKEKARAFYDIPEVNKDWSEGLYETVQAAMGK